MDPDDQAGWLLARAQLLTAEKQLTRERDRLAAQRRSLPRLRVDADYGFDTASGPATLRDLFDGQQQLLMYHFMFGPDWDEGCPSCSFWADSFDGAIAHLTARNTAFACVSSAPLAKLLDYRERLGWSFEWVSSEPSTFNADMGFSPNADRPSPLAAAEGEEPGVSAFTLEGDDVYLTYQTRNRGLEAFNATYGLLDMTALGRHEHDGPMAWVRRNDSY